MDIYGQKVIHKVFGTGVISDLANATVTVDFNGEAKKFVYPQAFNGYLTAVDSDFCRYIDGLLREQSVTVCTASAERADKHINSGTFKEHSKRERYENFISSAYSISNDHWNEEDWNDEDEENWF